MLPPESGPARLRVRRLVVPLLETCPAHILLRLCMCFSSVCALNPFLVRSIREYEPVRVFHHYDRLMTDVSVVSDLPARRSRTAGTTRVPIASVACMSFVCGRDGALHGR